MRDIELPFFTIVIPTYNVAHCIERALDSIRNQSYQLFECLVIDACSTDGTLKILEEHYEPDRRFKILSENDLGVYDAMNKGISKANGKFIYFMGADDYLMHDNILQRVKDGIEQKDADIIYGNVNSPVLGDNYAGEFDTQRLLYMNICHQSIFYNTRVFKVIGNFNCKYNIHADWEHNLNWFFHPKIASSHINESIAFYDGNGLSATQKDHSFKKDYLKLVYKYASRKHNKLEITAMLLLGFFKRL